MAEQVAAGTPCVYCGLPCGADRRLHEGEPFCCLGCVLARGLTGARGEEGAARLAMARFTVGAFFTMNVMAFSLVLYAEGLAPAADGAESFYQIFRVLALLASVPVLVLLGAPLLAGLATPTGVGHRLTDVLILVSVGAAYGFSLHSVRTGRGHVYFDAASMTLLFLTLGRFLSARARAGAAASLRTLAQDLPRDASVISEGGEVRRLPLEEIRPGMRVRVPRGGAIPVDGVLLDPFARIDQAVVTGESDPAERTRGEALFAGSFNLGAPLELRVTGAVGGRLLEEMDRLLEEARRQGTPFLARVETVAGAFLSAVLLLAAATFAFWWSRGGLEVATLHALAVLLAACPCALGIAAPLAHWAGLARAARLGVAVLDGASLERLARVRRVVFDKTGTLTRRREHEDTGAPSRRGPEELRPGAADAIRELREAGLEVRILSGDTAARVDAVARPLGVRAIPELLPTEKVELVRRMAQARPVLFVGDGLNDAPALGAAQVGLAMGDGTDLARSAASMVLLRDDLRRVPALVRIARDTMRIQNRNLLWTFGYNALLLVAAARGSLHPGLAALAMVASSLLVVLTSTRSATSLAEVPEAPPLGGRETRAEPA